LEELFGDIQDEFDTEDAVMDEFVNGIYIFSGKAEIDEINERFDLEIPTGDFETIAGYIMDHSGSIPSVNDRIVIGEFQIEILKASRHRIDLIQLSSADEPS